MTSLKQIRFGATIFLMWLQVLIFYELSMYLLKHLSMLNNETQQLRLSQNLSVLGSTPWYSPKAPEKVLAEHLSLCDWFVGIIDDCLDC